MDAETAADVMGTTVEIVGTLAQCHEMGYQFSFAKGDAVDHIPQANRPLPTCNAGSLLETSGDNVREHAMPISVSIN